MTVFRRFADARFLLPAPSRLEVVGDEPEWREAVHQISVPDGEFRALVGHKRALTGRVDDRVESAIVLGGTRLSHPDAWSWLRVLERRGPNGPRLFVPLNCPNVARYVFTRWAHPPQRWRRGRNAVLAPLVARGGIPARRCLAVGSAHRGPPYLLASARSLGLPPAVDWFCSLGDGDDLQRGAFHVFVRDAAEPAWVVKFARMPGDDEPFRAEAAAAELLARRAPVAARHAPRLLGRCDVDVPASVETAATGPTLNTVLDGPSSRPDKLHLVEQTVEWVLHLAEESRGAGAELEPELHRLEAEILPRWREVPAGLTRSVRALRLRPVLAHHDLGSWNIVASESGPLVLDWESARFPALPLWDLLYFLTDALTALDGPAPDDEKVDRAIRLLRGDAPESDWLFGHLHAAAHRLEIPTDALGPLATLAWLHHAGSHARRHDRAVHATGTRAEVGAGPLEQLAGPWLRDPALGISWPAARSR